MVAAPAEDFPEDFPDEQEADGRRDVVPEPEHAHVHQPAEAVAHQPAPPPFAIKPADAVRRRDRILEEHRAALNQRRVHSRALRRRQVREGCRPPRRQARRDGIVLVQANVTQGSTWEDELLHGDTFCGCDFAAIQEHKLKGDQRGIAERQLMRAGWDCVVDEAYIKVSAEGGGTGLLAARWSGVRPVGDLSGEAAAALRRLQGRCSLGVVDLLGGVLLASFYGLDGQPVSKQISCWLDLGCILRILGIPFIVMGDWQVLPREMEASGWLRTLGARIAAPAAPTNLHTKRVIDYAVMSAELANLVVSVEVMVGARFSPHAPVQLVMRAPRSLGVVSRLARPRLLEAAKPERPTRTSYDVDWTEWGQDSDDFNRADGYQEDRLDAKLNEWYASANLELCDIFGMTDTQQEALHTGIGLPPRTVAGTVGPRRAGTCKEGGVLGHRLAWTAKALHLAEMWFPARLHDDDDDRHALPADAEVVRGPAWLFRCFARRAGAFLKERVVRDPSEADAAETDALRSALELLASTLVEDELGRAPLDRWIADGAMCSDWGGRVAQAAKDTAGAIASLSARRRRNCTKALRAWAAKASVKEAHAATRPADTVTAYSASASKQHRGERTEQMAADRGLREWSEHWLASDQDHGADIADMVTRVAEAGPRPLFISSDGALPALPLPPITHDRVDRVARRFSGTTGLGHDVLRLRHVSWLSRGAKQGLAYLLTVIETRMKWPVAARGTVAVALAKKGGGSRLIGLIVALYRLWARIRYEDLQEALEARLARPFLAAAPGEGAARAAATASLLTEAAWSRGEAAATTTADVAKFYEQITFEELAHGALAFGIPPEVVALALHQYAGPRRVRVGGACSQPAYARRSVIPGCTWATVFVRAIIIGPAEKFQEAVAVRFRGFDVAHTLSIYIDDLVMTTMGCSRDVALLHVWATRLLLQWAAGQLRKRLAEGKLFCIASSAPLRFILARLLRDTGCQVVLEGDILGADFSAGGLLRKRRGLRTRLARNRRRRNRVRWLARAGGRAREVARGGTGPSIAYGATAAGLPPRAQLTRRQIQGAATSISASGASLTAKLAVGGPLFAEADPSVLDPAPPLVMLLTLLWDVPRLRAHFIDSWRRFAVTLAGLSPPRTWLAVRGIVSAAWAHIRQLGGEWVAPFTLRLLDADVNILSMPPKRVLGVLQAHARRHFDRALVSRLAHRYIPDDVIPQVLARYADGVDWDEVRWCLKGADGHLEAAERHAMLLCVTSALWPEERRWRAGLLGVGSCTTCFGDTGSFLHRFRDCHGLEDYLTWQRAAGRVGRASDLRNDEALFPLAVFGLPPRRGRWQPAVGRRMEGSLRPEGKGLFFGDGSGVRQECIEGRRATWALVKWDTDTPRFAEAGCNGGPPMPSSLFQRGAVEGWHPTVPRAEISAVAAFLEVAAPGSTYCGDCRYALDAVMAGVPPRFRSSRSGDADLWRTIKRLLEQKVAKEAYFSVR